MAFEPPTKSQQKEAESVGDISPRHSLRMASLLNWKVSAPWHALWHLKQQLVITWYSMYFVEMDRNGIITVDHCHQSSSVSGHDRFADHGFFSLNNGHPSLRPGRRYSCTVNINIIPFNDACYRENQKKYLLNKPYSCCIYNIFHHRGVSLFLSRCYNLKPWPFWRTHPTALAGVAPQESWSPFPDFPKTSNVGFWLRPGCGFKQKRWECSKPLSPRLSIFSVAKSKQC